MAITSFETQAIITLVDHLSGPLNALAGKVSAQQSGFQRIGTKMADFGRSMTLGVTLPVAEAMRHMHQHALELSKVENTMEGVLYNRARTMAQFKDHAQEYVKANKEILKQATDQAIKDNPLVRPIEFQKSALAATKAGLDMNASAAIATQAVDFAIAGRIEQSEAAENLIQLGNSFGIVTKNADGTTKSVKELNKEYGRLSDMIATMSTNANMTTEQAVQSVRLSAPLAHQIHMNPAILGAMSEAQAEFGFKGSEASVAQRAFLMAVMAPKAGAAPALARSGIDLNKYRTFNESGITPESLVQFTKNSGYSMKLADAQKAFKEAHEEAEKNPDIDFHGALTHATDEAIKRLGKKGSPVSPDMAAKLTNKFLSQQVTGTDAFGLIMAMREKGVNAAQLKEFGEGRQVPRWLPFLNKAPEGQFDPFEFAMERMFGKDWREAAKHHGGDEAFIGNARRQAEEHMHGYEGAIQRMGAAMDKLMFRLYESKVFDTVANTLSSVADAIAKFGESNPDTLRQIVEGLMALAAVGPIAWLGGTLMNVAGGLGALAVTAGRLLGIVGAASTGAAGVAAAGAGSAGAATAAAAAAGATAVGGAETAAAAGGAITTASRAAGLVGALTSPLGMALTVGALTISAAAVMMQADVANFDAKKAREMGWDAPPLSAFEKAQHKDSYLKALHAGAPFEIDPTRQGFRNDLLGSNVVIPAPDRVPSSQFAPQGMTERKEWRDPANMPSIGTFRPDWLKDLVIKHEIEWLPPKEIAPKAVERRASPNETLPYFARGQGGGQQSINVDVESTVQGTVTGEATLMQSIKVDASPLLLATVDSAKQATRIALNGEIARNRTGATMTGSNAAKKSMPLGLGSSFGGFKPTSSGM